MWENASESFYESLRNVLGTLNDLNQLFIEYEMRLNLTFKKWNLIIFLSFASQERNINVPKWSSHLSEGQLLPFDFLLSLGSLTKSSLFWIKRQHLQTKEGLEKGRNIIQYISTIKRILLFKF